MAQLIDEKIRAWIDSNLRSGWGWGSGSGEGDGWGWGEGDGSGLKSLNGFSIFYIDNLPTIFYRICGNLARGAIVDSNTFELTPTVIVKGDGYFAHGDTAKEAAAALQAKIIKNMSVEERIKMFVKEHKPDVKYKGMDYYEWHHTLTGSCKFGRDNFVKQHNIDLEAEYTPQEFIKIVKNAYGSEVVKQLESEYE